MVGSTSACTELKVDGSQRMPSLHGCGDEKLPANDIGVPVPSGHHFPFGHNSGAAFKLHTNPAGQGSN